MNPITKYWLLFSTLRSGVKWAFRISLLIILLIEFWLINEPGPFEWCYAAGIIILKLSYSITAATIFFFINQQLPKEEKKLKFSSHIYSRILAIRSEIIMILGYIHVDSDNLDKASNQHVDEGYEIVKTACGKIQDAPVKTVEAI